jgi:1-acyl-sn-glycerol-3-phosphate acyltransferase
VFGIYPEGTRTRDGYLHRGHTGVARLALSTGAPVVPVGLVGTDEIQATDAKTPRLFRDVRVRFGDPIDPQRYAARDDEAGIALRAMTDEVMFEIQALSGYEYVDTYATKRAEDVPVDTAVVTSLEPLTEPGAALPSILAHG